MSSVLGVPVLPGDLGAVVDAMRAQIAAHPGDPDPQVLGRYGAAMVLYEDYERLLGRRPPPATPRMHYALVAVLVCATCGRGHPGAPALDAHQQATGHQGRRPEQWAPWKVWAGHA